MDFVNFDNIGNYQLRVTDKIDNAGLHNFLTASLIENHEKRFLFNKCVSQNNVQKISGSIIFFGFSQVYWGFFAKGFINGQENRSSSSLSRDLLCRL